MLCCLETRFLMAHGWCLGSDFSQCQAAVQLELSRQFLSCFEFCLAPESLSKDTTNTKSSRQMWDKELLLWWLSRGFRHGLVPIYWFTRGLFCFESYLSFCCCCCWEFLQAYDMFRSNLLSFPPLHFSPVSFTFTSQLYDPSLSQRSLIESTQCYLYVQACRTVYCGMGKLSRDSFLKKTGAPSSPSSHQLPIGWDFMVSFLSCSDFDWLCCDLVPILDS